MTDTPTTTEADAEAAPRSPCTIVAVDTETTRLRRPYLRDGRRVWETGIIRREPDGTEHSMRLFTRVSDLGLLPLIPLPALMDTHTPLAAKLRAHLPADVLTSLDIGGFWDRHPEMTGPPGQNHPELVTEQRLADLLMAGWLTPGSSNDPLLFVGAVPWFDDLGIFDVLYRQKKIPIEGDVPWNYHLVDVEAVAAGRLQMRPPWKLSTVAKELGLDLDGYQKHTALSDARLALDVFDRVYDAPRLATGGIIEPAAAEEPPPESAEIPPAEAEEAPGDAAEDAEREPEGAAQ